MIETVVTVSMTVGSVLLFCYWFRYTCHLILSAVTSQDYATNMAQVHQLCFQEAQLRLRNGATELDRLKGMLDRDYATLARLTNNAEDAQAGMERRMLAIHYNLMSLSYRVSRTISASAARRSLEEMSMVVAHFANSIGEGVAVSAAA